MKAEGSGIIRLIAVFKLLKAATLIAVGVGVLKLVHTDPSGTVERWTEVLGVKPGGRYVDLALGKLANVSPHRMRELGVGSFVYAGLFLTEGLGLWLGKRWAEWFTVVITASLIPLEVFEIHHRPTVGKVVVTLLNVAIVVYLVARIRRDSGSEVRSG